MKSKYMAPSMKVVAVKPGNIISTSHGPGHCSNCKWGDADGDGSLEEFWHCDHSPGWGGQGKFYPDCDY